MGQWLEACFDQDPSYATVMGVAYESYKFYAEQNGMRPMTSKALGRRLTERGITRGRNNRGMPTYLGIKLRDNAVAGG